MAESFFTSDCVRMCVRVLGWRGVVVEKSKWRGVGFLAFDVLDAFQYLSGAAFAVNFGLQDHGDSILPLTLLLLAFTLLCLLLQHQMMKSSRKRETQNRPKETKLHSQTVKGGRGGGS